MIEHWIDPRNATIEVDSDKLAHAIKKWWVAEASRVEEQYHLEIERHIRLFMCSGRKFLWWGRYTREEAVAWLTKNDRVFNYKVAEGVPNVWREYPEKLLLACSLSPKVRIPAMHCYFFRD